MKIAIVYDRVNKWGGAERVLLAFHELFPDAPLYTAVYHSQKAPWAKIFPEVIPTFLNKIPFFRDKHHLLGTFTPIAFESLSFSSYDLVISVTSEAAKGIIVKPPTLHICYCLTPTRYLWSGHDMYFRNPLLRFTSRPAVYYLRYWDKIAADRPDVFIAISTAVQKRIKKYYRRESSIIYPPTDLEEFQNSKTPKLKAISKSKIQNPKSNFFLLVSRLIPYKRTDIAIEAFNELGVSLVIIGSGTEEAKLKSQANKNIKFIGELTDRPLAQYYERCSALIFPQEEDFGLTAVEVQAAGKPVIAFKAGGVLDTVIDPAKSTLTGQAMTGVFFEEQNKESLIKAIKKFQRMRFDKRALIKNAERFSKEKFKIAFRELVDNAI